MAAAGLVSGRFKELEAATAAARAAAAEETAAASAAGAADLARTKAELEALIQVLDPLRSSSLVDPFRSYSRQRRSGGVSAATLET